MNLDTIISQLEIYRVKPDYELGYKYTSEAGSDTIATVRLAELQEKLYHFQDDYDLEHLKAALRDVEEDMEEREWEIDTLNDKVYTLNETIKDLESKIKVLTLQLKKQEDKSE